MTTHIGSLPSGSMGFDCNARVMPNAAKAMANAGFKFVVRYVKRVTQHSYDISAAEIIDLMNAGLGLMLVQHVDDPGWVASLDLGRSYGAVAANEAKRVGYPKGCNVWLDIEEVNTHCTPQAVADYANAWYDEVASAGYVPGVYIGDTPGLNNRQAYTMLKFKNYWGAYNVDVIPDVRGYQMRQHEYPKTHVPVVFQYDTDTIQVDKLGGTPVLYLP